MDHFWGERVEYCTGFHLHLSFYPLTSYITINSAEKDAKLYTKVAFMYMLNCVKLCGLYTGIKFKNNKEFCQTA